MHITLSSLPNPALHRIFELVCECCTPEAPGTCQLALVSKRWRHLSCGVKGLRVLFQGDQQQQVDSFCAWLRLHAGQVTVLAISSPAAADVLRFLAKVAAAAAAVAAAPMEEPAAAAAADDMDTEAPPAPTAAAAAGRPLPLQRLVVTGGELLCQVECACTLRPLLGALPHLRHLHLRLVDPVPEDPGEDNPASHEPASMAVEMLCNPLHHSTSLTSLVLDGPRCQGPNRVLDGAQGMLLRELPPTLRSLTWRCEVEDAEQLSFDLLTALTHLRLSPVRPMHSSLPDNAFTALQQLRQLELQEEVNISEQGLLACKEQLVGLALEGPTDVLAQLNQLQALGLGLSNPELLQQAPSLQELHVALPGEEDTPAEAWARPWALQQYSGLTGLQRLSMTVDDTQAAPLGLCGMTQLKQLAICDEGCGREPAACASWVMVLAGLVNLEVLCVPVVLTACWHPWLTGLTRLAVLETCSGAETTAETASAASHISRLLAAEGDSSSSSSSSSSIDSAAGVPRQVERVRVVCFGALRAHRGDVELHEAVAAAVPVLPPNKHLFSGSWQQLQECGVELWPAPVAARLQQLLPSVQGCGVLVNE